MINKIKNLRMLYFFLFIGILSLSSCVFQSKEMFSTRQNENRYNWTLTSRLGQALELAEKKYGRRDLSWTLLGIEIYDKMYPRIWYLNHLNEQKQIIVQLSRFSTWSRKSALFELSHEVIHILSPTEDKETVSFFEEGLAVYFSIQYLKHVDLPVDPAKQIKDTKYRAAYNHVLKLYTQFENVDDKIKILRRQSQGFSNISADQFEKAFPGLGDKFYAALARNFSRTVLP